MRGCGGPAAQHPCYVCYVLVGKPRATGNGQKGKANGVLFLVRHETVRGGRSCPSSRASFSLPWSFLLDDA